MCYSTEKMCYLTEMMCYLNEMMCYLNEMGVLSNYRSVFTGRKDYLYENVLCYVEKLFGHFIADVT